MSERQGNSDQASAHSTGDNNLVVGRVNTLSQIFYERATFAMGWVFLVLAAALAGYAVVNWPGGSRKQYVGFFAFLLLAAVAAVCHVGVRKPDSGHSGGVGPHARRQEFRNGARPRLPDLLLIAALVFSLLSWWSFENVVRNGEVTATFDVHGSRPLTGAPDSVLTMKLVKPDRADLRDRLRLTLRIGEDDPDAPACSHKTRVDLTAVTAGVTPHEADLPARSTTDFALGDLTGRTGAVFEIRVRTDEGCALRLVGWQGILHND
ncbi:hypothetical protein ACIQZN_17570 [Streptomyces sp. NPDC097595]|uniref:hypothetical protein n=1 Tax=Streptomyces sp. NPDC097595 TaxID=3366090 RepID=UPI00380CAF0A